MPWRALALVLLAAAWSPARADAPAPWALCHGASPGAPCHSLYYPRGLCQKARADCSLDDEMCLVCVSGADASYHFDVVPAALSCAGLLALIAFARLARRPRAG
jgi:hypothetical protein